MKCLLLFLCLFSCVNKRAIGYKIKIENKYYFCSSWYTEDCGGTAYNCKTGLNSELSDFMCVKDMQVTPIYRDTGE